MRLRLFFIEVCMIDGLRGARLLQKARIPLCRVGGGFHHGQVPDARQRGDVCLRKQLLHGLKATSVEHAVAVAP